MRFIILLALFISLFSCKSVQQKADTIAIKFEATECFGKCPTYSMEIYNSGKVKLNGKMFMDKLGVYEYQLNSKDVKAIKRELDDLGFMNLKDAYGLYVSDIPSTIITYNGKRVELKMDYPKKLYPFILKIDGLRKRPNWAPIAPTNHN